MDYRVPQTEMRFALNEVLDIDAHAQNLHGKEPVDSELAFAIIEEAARFAHQELNPCYRSGDEEGCVLQDDGGVTTPKGFKEAYRAYVDGGWPGLSTPTEFGGQNLPDSLHTIVSEITGSANWSWAMYPGLSQGALHTILQHGTQTQQQRYLSKLSSGQWTGTMCLTEPHCGTDLGMLRTKAVPQADGSYAISGGKIFISSGDHDLAENIVHIVLARLPDAPAGTKGISLFIVPKIKLNTDNEPSEQNGVSVGRIEEKMGIHGNSTCALNFDSAQGELLGQPHQGMKAMFTFMNLARIGTAIQGLTHAERALQSSVAYSCERLQSRGLAGATQPQLAADPIINHPDVRRMVLHNKVIAEGLRLFIYDLAFNADRAAHGAKAQQAAEQLRLALLTPIAKAFSTELGFECASNAVQVMGGHGYIREWGVEQNLRDARIATLYEGTTGIQALDLIGRKLALDNGQQMRLLLGEFALHASNSKNRQWAAILSDYLRRLKSLSEQLLLDAMSDRNALGAASVDYLMFAGYVVLGHYWLRAADAASDALKAGSENPEFYRSKLDAADYYFKRVITRCLSLDASARAGAEILMNPNSDYFVAKES